MPILLMLNHRGRDRPSRELREPPMLEATSIRQLLAWDITLLTSPVKGKFCTTVLHSEIGAPTHSYTMAAKLPELQFLCHSPCLG